MDLTKEIEKKMHLLSPETRNQIQNNIELAKSTNKKVFWDRGLTLDQWAEAYDILFYDKAEIENCNKNKDMENLKNDIKKLKEYIELYSTASGIEFMGDRGWELRNRVETLEKDVLELEKRLNYNKTSETIDEPEDKDIVGKTPPSKESMDRMVNHPTHYQSKESSTLSIECIDVMEATKGWYNTAMFCELNAFKYNWRLGQKDLIPQELGKINWYSEKAVQLWKNNLTWFYPKNQHNYAIIQEIRMKDPTTGEWSDAVLYTDGKGTYVRNKLDFINKFEKK